MKPSIHSETRTIVSITQTTIHPYMLMVVVLGVAGAIFGINKVSPWFMLIVFLASCAGMGIVLSSHRKENRRESGETALTDYEKLSATDLVRFVPWLNSQTIARSTAMMTNPARRQIESTNPSSST